MPFRFGIALHTIFDAGEDIRLRFEQLIEQVHLAERLGFDSITKTAHHSARPVQFIQQLPFLARLTGETERMRLNAGVVLLSLHKPLDIAEQLAAIDIMSNGRLIFGVGLGYREVEFRAFGTTQKERARRLEENLIAIKRLWTEDAVTMTGSHFELIEASCSPKPLQKPHPPVWMGANADPAIRRAARMADCWYINPHNRIDTTRRQLDVYRAALDAAGKPFPAELPMRRDLFVAESREAALRIAGPHIKRKYDNYARWGQEAAMPDGDNDLTQAIEALAGDRFILGAPDDVAEQIIGLNRDLGVNHLVISIQWPGMPQQQVLDTMHLLAERVMPRVRAAVP